MSSPRRRGIGDDGGGGHDDMTMEATKNDHPNSSGEEASVEHASDASLDDSSSVPRQKTHGHHNNANKSTAVEEGEQSRSRGKTGNPSSLSSNVKEAPVRRPTRGRTSGQYENTPRLLTHSTRETASKETTTTTTNRKTQSAANKNKSEEKEDVVGDSLNKTTTADPKDGKPPRETSSKETTTTASTTNRKTQTTANENKSEEEEDVVGDSFNKTTTAHPKDGKRPATAVADRHPAKNVHDAVLSEEEESALVATDEVVPDDGPRRLQREVALDGVAGMRKSAETSARDEGLLESKTTSSSSSSTSSRTKGRKRNMRGTAAEQEEQPQQARASRQKTKVATAGATADALSTHKPSNAAARQVPRADVEAVEGGEVLTPLETTGSETPKVLAATTSARFESSAVSTRGMQEATTMSIQKTNQVADTSTRSKAPLGMPAVAQEEEGTPVATESTLLPRGREIQSVPTANPVDEQVPVAAVSSGMLHLEEDEGAYVHAPPTSCTSTKHAENETQKPSVDVTSKSTVCNPRPFEATVDESQGLSSEELVVLPDNKFTSTNEVQEAARVMDQPSKKGHETAADGVPVADSLREQVSAMGGNQQSEAKPISTHCERVIDGQQYDRAKKIAEIVRKYSLVHPSPNVGKWANPDVEYGSDEDCGIESLMYDTPSFVPPDYSSDDVAGTSTQPLAPRSDSDSREGHSSTPAVQPIVGNNALPSGQFYIEETAWQQHNPRMPVPGADDPGAVPAEELQPIPPPPPPLPSPEKFPNTGKCTWTFDSTSLVLLGNFVQEDGTVEVSYEDEKFLLMMMERDDITCITEGLARDIDPDLWNLSHIVDVCGKEFFHRFRKFDREEIKPPKKAGPAFSRLADVISTEGNVPRRHVVFDHTEPRGASQQDDTPAADVSEELVYDCSEQKAGSQQYQLVEQMVTCEYWGTRKSLSMRIMDYERYVSMRQSALKRIEKEGREVLTEEEMMFRYVDHDGEEHEIDVTASVLYMIDVDVVKLLPQLNRDLKEKFLLSGCLPGGIHCMMNEITENGRPFMGPNAYFTPPDSFTRLHQDGHGTVDSGHLCLSGYNEVVMLRRLTERHKINAWEMLRGEGSGVDYGLYDLPHADDTMENSDWPVDDAIEACRRMNYCPSVFILKPGQLVHINKGRLHAFRKLSPSPLPEGDCHCQLRADLLASLHEPDIGSFFCFSIAWDWMFRGITSEGICREVVATLEGAILARINRRESLAVPELALLQMARALTKMTDRPALANVPRLLQFHTSKSRTTHSRYKTPTKDILRGILPGLRYVVNQHAAAIHRAESLENEAWNGPRVSVAKRPNSWENPQCFKLDPYGNGDYFCKLCHSELSNVYMHCDGCEVLLDLDFNICVACHAEGLYKKTIQMHPLNPKRHSTINHTGDMKLDRRSRCPCKNGPVCRRCGYCSGCSCKCHQWFTLHRRFFDDEDESSLVRRVLAVVGDQGLPYSDQVVPRLEAAARPMCKVAPMKRSDATDSIEANLESGKKRPSQETTGRTPKSKRQRSGESNPRRGETQTVSAKNVMSTPMKKRCTAVKKQLTPFDHFVKDFDPSQVPEGLLPSSCSHKVPKSCDDLSDGSLAFSRPKGQIPLTNRGCSAEGLGRLGPEDLCGFVEVARQLSSPSPSDLRQLLPVNIPLSESHVRHFYRNFADAKDISGDLNPKTKKFRIHLSPREVCICLYGNMKGYTETRCCKTLMPYRLGKNLRGCYLPIGASSRNMPESLKMHLEETVGVLFRMEEERRSGAECLAAIRMTMPSIPMPSPDADATKDEACVAQSSDVAALKEDPESSHHNQEILGNQAWESTSESV